MISQLSIHNYGLIDKLNIEFDKSLNVLTGETGAGKSIIIGALRFALGERFSSEHMRDPKNACTVELVLDLPKSFLKDNEAFSQYMPDDETQLILSRTYAPDGKNKIKVNGFALTLGELKSLGDALVDFHGPNDHQMLLSEKTHIMILDRLCADIKEAMSAYRNLYNRYLEIKQSLDDIQTNISSKERDLEIVLHQCKELERVPLDKKSYENTLDKESQLKNRQKLHENVSALLEIVEGQDGGIDERASKAFPFLKSLSLIDKSATALQDKFETLQELSSEILSDLRHYEQELDFEPEEAQELVRRCDAYHDILRKYGPTIEDAAEFYKNASQKRDFLKNLEHNDKELKSEIKKIDSKLRESALKITKTRQKAAKTLASSIESELKDLGIAHVRFECRITACEANTNGMDHVTFYLSPNLGEDLKPLADIVSSGEAARVMLALKKALTKVDPIPVLIFDEIDAQIGGRLGSIIGQKLAQLSKDRQVILITHLPQIAAFATKHFKVIKLTSSGKTLTSIEHLDEVKRLQEMSQMMDGTQESAISLTHAKEMLKTAEKYR